MTKYADLDVQWDRINTLRGMRELDDDKALIAAMGINQSSYSRVINGKQRPGTRFIAALCVALEVKPSDICTVVTRRAAA